MARTELRKRATLRDKAAREGVNLGPGRTKSMTRCYDFDFPKHTNGYLFFFYKFKHDIKFDSIVDILR